MNTALGPLMIDLSGFEVTAEEKDVLQHPQVGGVILFACNVEHPKQLRHLTQQLRRLRPGLLVAVDQEGGRVQRCQSGFTPLPPMAALGASYQQDAVTAKQWAHTLAKTLATELLAVGVDFSFAPVLDLHRPGNHVIGDRSFGSDPETVIALAQAVISGLRAVGMASVGKHYPGHGYVLEDTHTQKVYDHRDYACMAQSDLRPFQVLSSSLQGMMAAHVVYTQVDHHPAVFSEIWLKKILREQLGFQGALFSDDLNMVGAHAFESLTDRVQCALEAGCDMVLCCHCRDALFEVLDHVHWDLSPESQLRLSSMRPSV